MEDVLTGGLVDGEHLGCDLTECFGFPVEIAFNWQTHRASRLLEFSQAEITKLSLLAVHQAEELVFAIKFSGVPGPTRIWREELHIHHGRAVGPTNF